MHIFTGSIHITLFVRKGIREERGTEVWEREVGVNQGLTSTKFKMANKYWNQEKEWVKVIQYHVTRKPRAPATRMIATPCLEPENPAIPVVLRVPQFLTDGSSNLDPCPYAIWLPSLWRSCAEELWGRDWRINQNGSRRAPSVSETFNDELWFSVKYWKKKKQHEFWLAGKYLLWLLFETFVIRFSVSRIESPVLFCATLIEKSSV